MSFIYALLVLVLGLVAGIVINVLATRLAAHRPIFGQLRCTRSPHALRAWQAAPVFGFVVQRGRCATCLKGLSPAYPLIELATAALFLTLYLLEGWGVPLFFHAIYVAFLILVLVIDLRHRDIYLSVIGLGSAVALLGSVLLPGVGIVSALIGAAVAGIFFLVAYLFARLLFRHIEEPLGLGDVFLALMMGLMLGFPNIVGALLVGPLLAGAAVIFLLVSRRRSMGDFIPYGVALCAAAILFLVYPTPFAEALRLPALVILFSDLVRF